MTNSDVTGAEELAESGVLRGRLSRIGLPQVLVFLDASKGTGVLSVVNAGIRKSVFLRGGRVVFAASSQTRDRLGEVLLRGGKISADEYLRLPQRIRADQRLGKVLVESRVLSPKDLWWAIEQQVQEIVRSIFTWEDGYFQFEESDRPNREKITVDLDVRVLIVEGIRRIDGSGPIRPHFVPKDSILVRADELPPMKLEPHERHVLDMVGKEATVADVCQESEIGEAETRKVLHSFLAVGVLATKERTLAPIPGKGDDWRSMVEIYNDMYRHLYEHMTHEIGPIAGLVLEKYLNDLKNQPDSVFEHVRLSNDGSLESQQLEKNVRQIEESRRREELVEALNELLYAELLAVKRTLGAFHESRLIHVFRQMREKE